MTDRNAVVDRLTADDPESRDFVQEVVDALRGAKFPDVDAKAVKRIVRRAQRLWRERGGRSNEIRHEEGDRWSVMNEGAAVFSGTLRQCEDWLDFQENRLANRNERSAPANVARRN